MIAKQQRNDAQGCFKVLVTLGLAYAAIEGGIVLIAKSLHGIATGQSAPDSIAVTRLAMWLLLTVIGPPLIFFLVNRSRPVITWRQAVAALPNLALAAWFVIGWAAPRWIGEGAAGTLPGIVVLEFIIIHASVGLVGLPAKIAQGFPEQRWWQTPRAVTGWLLLMYSIFAICISVAFKSAWLFVGFWVLIGNKFIDDRLTPAAQAEVRKNQHMARWSTSAAIYLVLVGGSAAVPVPRLGAYSVSEGDGLWDVHPEQAVAMGAVYYTALALCELYGVFRVKVAAARTVSA